MQDLIGQTLGHYRIVEKIGEGGMGEVYRARDETLDRDVAIKVLPEEVVEKSDRLARFEREAKAVAKLNHPNILDVYELGGDEGRPFMATELLEGESLRELISKGGITTGKAVEYARAIADGLAAAHDKGIIHRDLKPENVFLTTDGRIKILDFGLAKLKLPEADLTTETPTATLDTDPGGLIGTVPYMAPEQVQGQPADHRSDIFALGVVLYEMLTGNRPFGGSTTVETAAAILKEDPEPISVAAPAVSPAFGSVVSKCLEKRPEDRFSSAHDLSLTLGAIDPTAKAGSFAERRWPHILAVVVAAAIALFFVFPPEGLFERLAEQPAEVIVPRIVVLPFENLGPPDDEYFADGITEEITSRLAAVSGLQVISRTSAMQYKGTDKAIREIGEELNVQYALEGTIRWDRSGEGYGRVRITPQLIKVADDSHLWSERYDRLLEDIFTVQSDIAEQVLIQLRARILEPERRAIEAQPTESMEAYQAYLAGIRYARGSREERYMRLTVEMFERAVQLDPGFAIAHAALSKAHSRLHHYRYDFTTERLDKAKLFAERALELQPGLPEGHRALGWYYYWGHRDYDRALEHFAVSAERLPNDPDLLKGTFAVLRRQGRWNDALEALERWRLADPQSYVMALESLNTYSNLREFEKAEEGIRRAVAIAPDLPDAYYLGALNFVLWDGATDRARLLLESAPNLDSPEIVYQELLLDLYDRRPESVLARLNELSIDAFSLTYWYIPRGLLECTSLSQMSEWKRAEAACASAVELLEREIEAKPHDFLLHIALGHTYALLGRKEEAMRAGEQAVELMPISKDAVDGPDQAIELAKIYSRVGEADKALDLIDELLAIPSWLSVGLLRLDPVWDPLRDHPRFQALLEEYEIE